MHLKDIMTRPPVTLRPDTPVGEVATTLVKQGISGAPVVDQFGELVGIVSEADLLELQAGVDPRSSITALRRHPSILARTAADIMTRDVAALPESAHVEQAARMMLDLGYKRIPVVAGNLVVGIVSRSDIVRVLASADAAIGAEARMLLDEEIATLGRFEVRVSHGVVTLVGPDDLPGRQLAEAVLGAIPGVIEVRFAALEATPVTAVARLAG